MLAPQADTVSYRRAGQGGRRRMVSEGTMKDWVFELVCTGAAGRMDEAVAWANRAARGWAALPKLATLDLYAPVTGGVHDPFNDDGPGPLFIAMLAFPSREALAAAVASPELTSSLGGRPGDLAWTGSAFERHFYPVGGKTGPLTAPFSYVVRYHKPAEDEAAFIRNYVDTHPPTLATLPGIRSVMCCFPLPIAAQGLAAAGYIIGNEVAFDSVAAFNTAMQSPVRQELRRHFHEFPPFSGINTHFPMNRTRLF
jgi:uncharacterized protein (TIGR02118 family)